MNNNVITTSQNIKGDISSCQTNVVRVHNGRDIFTQNITEIATNNCTGQVTQYNTWEFTGLVGFLLIGFGVVAFIMFVAWWDNY